MHVQLAAVSNYTDIQRFVWLLGEIVTECMSVLVYAAPPYLAAWMSGPLAYISFPQTFAPSHRAQVLI